VNEEGEFVSVARFGNEKSPSGSRFRVVVLMCKDGAEAAAWKAGDSMRLLPPRIARTKVIDVVRRAAE
jgi:hypothetical protein